ncbi:UDP-N-acetylmuramate dehydrogenase [Candidatus Microgenomates bacterium]|nr:UDP-N-acetylmuramate dehydrogenase [Candidatus Microgenomates bacterium]
MDKYQKFADRIGSKYLTNGQLKFGELLSLHTTFRIGGPAEIFFKAKNSQELLKAVSLAQKFKIPYFILGGGSNILVGDLGFKGLVIKNRIQEIKVLGYDGKIKNKKVKIKNILVKAESGVLVNRLVRFTLDKGIGGFESFLGLPGTVGGAIYGNAHFLKTNDFFGDYLFEARLLTLKNEVKTVTKDYFNFDYKTSKIQKTKEIILEAVFSLRSEDSKKLWLKANQVMNYRLKTQPQGKFSAGCVFKNIKNSEAIRIPTPGFTTSAGFLIDATGLKNKKIGGAQVSSYHGNFILNLGSTTAMDVLKLIDLIKKKVKEKFGVELKEEIEMVGEFEKYG